MNNSIKVGVFFAALLGAMTFGLAGTALAAGTTPPGSYVFGTFEASSSSEAYAGAYQKASEKCINPRPGIVSSHVSQLDRRRFVAIMTVRCW
ncbi:hypothetical protein DFR72_117211 [Lentzea flaviverrucosa]|uniref:Uncharacterized protein n=1 Tax=Lentzea flaviverrucosa TaxID=200379 RepID=A0A1H9XRV4_9PSEU|nr:hypothetical protein DFR72_117211 [Lentzea flaviverrucosa]SES48895.1 hypothetical protein SAMN05216195_1178 [Lentzea flaviverrucosa]